MKPNICEKDGWLMLGRHKKSTSGDTKWWGWVYPSSLRGDIIVSGHCHDGNDEIDDGGGHTSHKILKMDRNNVEVSVHPAWTCFNPHHQRPAEAPEALVELGGVGEQQEERRQELQQRHRHKSGGGGRREAHERHKGEDLRRRGERVPLGKGENASHPSEVGFLCCQSYGSRLPSWKTTQL